MNLLILVVEGDQMRGLDETLAEWRGQNVEAGLQ